MGRNRQRRAKEWYTRCVTPLAIAVLRTLAERHCLPPSPAACHNCCRYDVALYRSTSVSGETQLVTMVQRSADTLVPSGGKLSITVTGLAAGYYQARC